MSLEEARGGVGKAGNWGGESGGKNERGRPGEKKSKFATMKWTENGQGAKKKGGFLRGGDTKKRGAAVDWGKKGEKRVSGVVGEGIFERVQPGGEKREGAAINVNHERKTTQKQKREQVLERRIVLSKRGRLWVWG